MKHKKKIFGKKQYLVGFVLGCFLFITGFYVIGLFKPSVSLQKKIEIQPGVEGLNKNVVDNTLVKSDLSLQNKQIEALPQKAELRNLDEIKVGFMGDFLGAKKDIDNPSFDGLKMGLDEANENNEFKNKKIKLFSLDHKGDVQGAISCIKNFADDLDVKILLTPCGSEELFASIALLEQKNFLVLFPVTLFDTFKHLNLKTFVFTFPVNEQEASVILNYGLDNLFIRKFAIFYEESYIGKGYLKDAEVVLEKRGLKNGVDYVVSSYALNTADTKNAADIINKFSPEAVLLFSSPVATTSLLNKLNIANIKYFLGTSFVEGDILFSVAKTKGFKFFISRAFPIFSKTKFYEEFLSCIKKQNKVESLSLLLGYLFARLFVEIVKKIDGSVTKESILRQIQQDKMYDVKGVKFYLDPSIKTNLNDCFHVIDINGNTFDLNGVLVGANGKT